MKRNNITAIIGKAILLDCDAVMYGIKYGSTYSISALRIMKAAENEINRLTKETFKRGFHYGYSQGFDSGFTCAEIAANCNITEAQNHYDNTPAPTSDLASNGGGGSPSTAGEVHPVIDNILNIIRP